MTRRPLRLGAASGFYGDRLAAARELVEGARAAGAPLDVLTGDWLAELTMGILLRDRQKDPTSGYARTFLAQLRDVLAPCLADGTRIIANAGGTHPEALAHAVRALAAELGLQPRVAVLTGDEITAWVADHLDDDTLRHLETGAPLSPEDGTPLAAHAYLGAGGIRAALEAGADIVLTGRTTDAAPIVAAAAWWHGWADHAWDRLAGALLAGHVVECGAQATGGNYAFFRDVPSLRRPGFPIAELHEDGSAVITKLPGTGGLVSVGTVTAQLLYEVSGPLYASPDVLARLDTVQLSSDGPDRVRLHGTRGHAPTDRLKAGVLLHGGFRNEVAFLVGGGDVPAKAEALLDAFWAAVGGRARFAATADWVLRGDHADALPQHRLSRVVVAARDASERKLDRAFTAPAIELALASVPGLTLDGLPGKPRAVPVFWPTLVPRDVAVPKLVIDGEEVAVPPAPTTGPWPELPPPGPPPAWVGPTVDGALGERVGARSGDKAGMANVGLWARDPADWPWLAQLITPETVASWLRWEGPVRVHPLPNLCAVNVELPGFLDVGVGGNLSPDPQAKGLAEGLRTVTVALPAR